MSENDLILEPQQALDHIDTETGPVTVRPDSFKDHFLWLQQELYQVKQMGGQLRCSGVRMGRLQLLQQ
jgi:hypothetical protein